MSQRVPAVGPPTDKCNSGEWAKWVAAAAFPLIAGPLWVSFRPTSWPDAVGTWTFVVLVELLAVSVITDLHRRRIPNWVTYTSFLWALVLSGASTWAASQSATRDVQWTQSLSSVSFGDSAIGGFGILCLMFALISLSKGGGGDVKLAACLGALLGGQGAIDAILFSFVIGGAGILIYSLWKGGPWLLAQSLFQSIGSILFPSHIERPTGTVRQLLVTKMPLAPFFALGTIISMMHAYSVGSL